MNSQHVRLGWLPMPPPVVQRVPEAVRHLRPALMPGARAARAHRRKGRLGSKPLREGKLVAPLPMVVLKLRRRPAQQFR